MAFFGLGRYVLPYGFRRPVLLQRFGITRLDSTCFLLHDVCLQGQQDLQTQEKHPSGKQGNHTLYLSSCGAAVQTAMQCDSPQVALSALSTTPLVPSYPLPVSQNTGILDGVRIEHKRGKARRSFGLCPVHPTASP